MKRPSDGEILRKREKYVNCVLKVVKQSGGREFTMDIDRFVYIFSGNGKRVLQALCKHPEVVNVSVVCPSQWDRDVGRTVPYLVVNAARE